MKTTLRQLPAALRLFAGLLFTFITATTAVAQTSWADNAATVITNADGHDGTTADKAILIKDAAELAYFAKQVNAGGKELKVTKGSDIDNTGSDSKKNFSGYYFALSADIDLNGQNWTPIGNSAVNPFSGHFDGDGHVVKGLKVDIQSTTSDNVYAGLFGKVYGTLRNLGVWLAPDGITASSSGGLVYAGGLAGSIIGDETSSADIRNCYVEAKGNGAVRIMGTGDDKYAYAGGIVGHASYINPGSCFLTHCYATVDVIAKGYGYVNVGGIVGSVDLKTTISYTYATGKVEGTGAKNVYTGGICGNLNNGTLTNSLALNKPISCTSSNGGNTGCNRIAGAVFGNKASANYANPRMTLNGSLATSDAANDENGAPTNSDKFKEDLDPSSNNEWQKAWDWTEGQLPKLKKLVDAAQNTYDNALSGQTDHPITDYLTHSPWEDAAATEIKNAGGGDGSIGNPILIKDAAELAYLAKQVNDGNDLTIGNGGGTTTIENKNSGFSGKYFALSADIKLDGGEWTPIGTGSRVFCGHFDGKGHTVEGLTVTGIIPYAGLFGNVADGTICNLGVSLHEDGIKVNSSTPVSAGGIVGQLAGRNSNALLCNCYVVGNGKIEAGSSSGCDAGGIVGAISSGSASVAITHCYATVDVVVTEGFSCNAGGIVGLSGGPISYTYATGSVKVNNGSEQQAGGICGNRSRGNLTNNLALNSEVSVASGTDCHRIIGSAINLNSYTISSNYARPSMPLSSPAAPSTDATGLDGSDTWLDTFKADLQKEPATDNGWASGNWTWTDSNLPQLRMVTLGASGQATGNSDWASSSLQLPLSVSSYLKDKPVPTPPPTPEPEPEPMPTVYYTVTLPAVEGAITDPAAGTYEVESWSTFRFYLTLDTAYSESQPVVTTSRYETLAPRSSDGAYQVKYVRNDVEVYIDGIVKNPDPVANETLATVPATVRVFGNALSITVPQATTAIIFDLAGRPQRNLRLPDGETRVEGLPSGAYIVKFENGEVVKVIVTRSRT